MHALAQTNDESRHTRAANDDVYFGGSGTRTKYSYDPANLQLSAIQTTGIGAASQDYHYWWDRAGNLSRRTRPNVQEDFLYDALNRLDVVTRTAGGAATTTMDLAYAPNGNIVSKLAGGTGSDVGVYSYGTTGGGPHAVSNISGMRGGTFHYDAAGNLDCNSWSNNACNTGSSTVWSSYNLPTRINDGGTATYADFSYGPNRERVRTTEHQGNGVRVVYRVGPHFEMESTYNFPGVDDGTRYRSIVFYGQRMVYARVDDSLESSALQEGYLHQDHLGSIDQVSDAYGLAGVTSFSFDAFGKRRNAADWSNDNTDARFADNQWIEQGYTGHQQLDVVRLIHMNGRVQNPTWGRMLSPDPVLGDMTRPQDLNAYSYVGNNPLSFTDPSGYSTCSWFDGLPSKCSSSNLAAPSEDNIGCSYVEGIPGRRCS